MSKKKLTAKQKRFADLYVKTGNAAQSAIGAGYSKHSAKQIGKENLTKPYLKAYITAETNNIKSDTIMGAQEAMELLTRIARGQEKESVVVSTQFDVETVEKEADLKTRISALKEIMKRYPDNDELVKAQIRKLNAEADIKVEQSKSLKDNGAQVVPLIISTAPDGAKEKIEVDDNANSNDHK